MGILPGTILYVFLGATAGSLADSSQSSDNKTVKIVSITVGVVFGVLGIALVSYYAKRELNRVIARKEAELNQEQMEEDCDENKVELGAVSSERSNSSIAEEVCPEACPEE